MKGPQRLIRFNWAMKNCLEANFDIPEGYPKEIIVEEILEGESNQKAEKQKFNRVDILVCDKDNGHISEALSRIGLRTSFLRVPQPDLRPRPGIDRI